MSENRDYSRFLDVLRAAGRPLAEFEFKEVRVNGIPGDKYCKTTESIIARRLRGARAAGLCHSRIREGKRYSEYYLTEKPDPLTESLTTQITDDGQVTFA